MAMRTPNDPNPNPTPPLGDGGGRWTDRLADLVERRPWTILILSALLALVAGLYGVMRLPLDADTNSLISRDRPWMQRYLAFLDEFGDLEYLYVVVDTKGDRAAGERAVDDLLTSLRSIEDLSVHARIEPEEQWRMATRAMPIAELGSLVQASAALPEFVNAEHAFAVAERELNEVMGPNGFTMPKEERTTRGAAAFFLLDTIARAGGAIGAAPLADAPADEQTAASGSGFGDPPAPQYLVSDTGRLLFLAIMPRKDFGTLAAIEEPLRAIRGAIDAARIAHPAVEIGLTGKPVLQADELMTSTGDTTRSFTIGLIIVAGLCVIIYRDWRRPALALVAFGMAIAWTHGVAALLVGRLTLLSMVFMLVLIGAGLDYGIHVISRYTEFRATRDVRTSVRCTLRTAAIGTLTGAATSAAVFLLALFSSFQGLRELGVVAGAGLVLCAIAMVTTLPALLVIADRSLPPPAPRAIPLPGRSIGRSRRAAWWALGVGGVLVAASLVAAPLLLRFESNLLKLQAQGLESVAWEHRVLDDSASLSWFAAVIADDEADALAAIERARAEPEIGFVRSVFDIIPPHTAERDELRKTLLARASGAPSAIASEAITAERVERLGERVRAARTLATGSISHAERARLTAIMQGLFALGERLRREPEAARTELASAVAASRRAAQHLIEGETASLREALPAALRARFISPSGRYLVSLVPKEDTWEFEPLRRFVAALRRVDPEATGVPITQSESITDMTRAFLLISIASTLAVACITWLDFRRLRPVLLCVGVLAAGIAITVGLLAVLDIPLSLANFFGIPILIGLGIDSNIHLLHRADEPNPPSDTAVDDRAVEFGGTRNAVILTSLTTAIGFGGQIFASHQGMQGLGWIMAIGSLVCLATSIWLLPALLRVLRG
jgi:uncharacterized protein